MLPIVCRHFVGAHGSSWLCSKVIVRICQRKRDPSLTVLIETCQRILTFLSFFHLFFICNNYFYALFVSYENKTSFYAHTNEMKRATAKLSVHAQCDKWVCMYSKVCASILIHMYVHIYIDNCAIVSGKLHGFFYEISHCNSIADGPMFGIFPLCVLNWKKRIKKTFKTLCHFAK